MDKVVYAEANAVAVTSLELVMLDCTVEMAVDVPRSSVVESELTVVLYVLVPLEISVCVITRPELDIIRVVVLKYDCEEVKTAVETKVEVEGTLDIDVSVLERVTTWKGKVRVLRLVDVRAWVVAVEVGFWSEVV